MSEQRGPRLRRPAAVAALLAAGPALFWLQSVLDPFAFKLLLYFLLVLSIVAFVLSEQRESERHPSRAAIKELRGLVGSIGTVTEPLAPRGRVRLEGELWQAESVNGDTIPIGAAVRVCRADGLVLGVEPAERAAAAGCFRRKLGRESPPQSNPRRV